MRREIEGIRTVMRAIADLAVPRICICCGRRLGPEENHLCAPCLEDLPRCRFGKLRMNPMSERFNALLQELDGDRYEPFSFALPLFFYRGNYRNITRALKYRRNTGAGIWAAGLLAEELASSLFFRDVDLVVPVPLHWFRRWKRGYNQAEIIAGQVAGRLGVPMEAGIVRRRLSTRSQTKLGKEGRIENVRNAFRVNTRKLGKIQGQSGIRHILLLDDVFTTGATLAAAGLALRGALRSVCPGKDGCIRISVASLAAVIP